MVVNNIVIIQVKYKGEIPEHFEDRAVAPFVPDLVIREAVCSQKSHQDDFNLDNLVDCHTYALPHFLLGVLVIVGLEFDKLLQLISTGDYHFCYEPTYTGATCCQLCLLDIHLNEYSFTMR